MNAPSNRARTLLGYALVAAAASSWGTWPLILRRAEAIGSLDPALESFLLMAVLTVVAAPFCLFNRVRRRATWKEWAGMAWLGFGDGANVLLFFAAYQRTTVAVAVLTHYLTPIFVALAAPFVLKERVGARLFGAVGAAFLGLILLLAPSGTGGAHGALGAALGAGSAVFYASNVLVNKRLVGAFSGSELVFWHGVVATALLAIAVPHAAWSADTRAITVVATGSIGPGALGGLFFVWGLRRVPASHASTLTLLEPLVAVTSAAFLYGERLGAVGALGAVLILGGAAVVVSAGARR